MPDPTTVQQPDPAGFPGNVLRKMAAIRAFEDAATLRGPSPDFYGVLHALQVLTDEVRQLRAAIEPSSSPLITGAEAVREFRRLREVQ